MMLLLSVISSVAWPCAGLFHESEQLAESDAQSVILEAVEGGVRVSYSVAYEGDSESFGWMIPIFGEFVSIGERDPQDFADLFDWTQPNVDRNYASVEESGGCAGRAKSGDNALRADTGYANDGV
ncbi:MAG: hypothetical protein ACI8S6_005256, partial [Myxococcota bacterium]